MVYKKIYFLAPKLRESKKFAAKVSGISNKDPRENSEKPQMKAVGEIIADILGLFPKTRLFFLTLKLLKSKISGAHRVQTIYDKRAQATDERRASLI
jgi:hypothetical protein